MAVDVSQRPIVHPRAAKIGERARAVGRIFGLAARVAVQHADMQSDGSVSSKEQRKVLRNVAAGVADPGDVRQQFTPAPDRMRFHRIAAEHRQIRRRLADRRPAVGRIVISMRHEDVNPTLAKPFHPAQEAQLCADAALGCIVNVAGEHDKRSLPLDRHRPQRVERFERRIAQPVRNLRRHAAYRGERCVEMKVGSVNEPEPGPRHGS